MKKSTCQLATVTAKFVAGHCVQVENGKYVSRCVNFFEECDQFLGQSTNQHLVGKLVHKGAEGGILELLLSAIHESKKYAPPFKIFSKNSHINQFNFSAEYMSSQEIALLPHSAVKDFWINVD